MKINELQARMGKVDIVVEVVDIEPPREFEKFGRAGKVANARVKDDTGEIKLTLWNEQVDGIKKGDTLTITNGYVNEYRDELQLTTGKFGKLEVGGEKEEPESETPESNSLDVEEEDI